MRLRLVAAVLVFAGLGSAARADVTNPNFSPANPYPGYGAVAGWTESSPTMGSNTSGEPFFNNGTLPSGITTVGFIQQDGSFSQTLSLTPGQAYTLTFVDNARSGGVDPTMTVLLGGTTLLGPTTVTPVGDSNPFYFVSDTFVATSASEILEFSSSVPAGTDGTLLLSDVHVTAPTPEPSSLMLLGTSILGAAGVVRRRFVRS